MTAMREVISATNAGTIERTTASASASIFAPSAVTISERSRSASVRSATKCSHSFTRERSAVRNATSWETNRSRYRNAAREIPSARTDVTAKVMSISGGICQERVISHADTTVRLSADSSVMVPANTGQTRSRGFTRRRSACRVVIATAPPPRRRRPQSTADHGWWQSLWLRAGHVRAGA